MRSRFRTTRDTSTSGAGVCICSTDTGCTLRTPLAISPVCAVVIWNVAYNLASSTSTPYCARFMSALVTALRCLRLTGLRRFAAWYRNRLPRATSKVLRKKHYLTAVIGSVRQLAHDRLYYGVRLIPDAYCLPQIIRRERIQSPKCSLPSGFPCRQQLCARCRFAHLEFGITIAICLLAVAREKIRPA